MQAREDLTNVQFSILIRKEKRRHVYEPACKTNEPCCEFNESFFELVRQCDLVLHRWNISQSDVHFG